ncbi:MAG: CRISPR-associated endonuclease Cas1 [Atopobiaceae bacterium]|nr:CRISPR-associated endonuclease Cas1 [Atopobiaceae bacterium]
MTWMMACGCRPFGCSSAAWAKVVIAPTALATIGKHNVRIAYVDKCGDLLGAFVPVSHASSADVFLRQCAIYTNPKRRLALARLLEEASIHNMRANLRCCARRGREPLAEHVDCLSSMLDELGSAKGVDALRLFEARARKRHCSAFAEILVGTDFDFAKRTRRPPRDPGNAMVSFGNAILYNVVLQAIWRTSLDPKVGVVHAANRRAFGLDLDIADLFKPVIVDRVVFSLVNRRATDADGHFEPHGDDGAYLSRSGRRPLIDAMEKKLDDTVMCGSLRQSYRRVMSGEVARFQRFVVTGERYRPYKYY